MKDHQWENNIVFSGLAQIARKPRRTVDGRGSPQCSGKRRPSAVATSSLTRRLLPMRPWASLWDPPCILYGPFYKSLAEMALIPGRAHSPATFDRHQRALAESTLSSETKIAPIVPELSAPVDGIANAAPDFWRPKVSVDYDSGRLTSFRRAAYGLDRIWTATIRNPGSSVRRAAPKRKKPMIEAHHVRSGLPAPARCHKEQTLAGLF